MKDRCISFMKDLQQKNIQELEKWFNDDSIVWIPPCAPLKGKRRIIVMFRAIFSKYNDLNWQVQKVHEVEDFHCIYTTQSWGEFKSGKPYENHIITDIQFNNKGEIIGLSDYFKSTVSF